MLNTILEEANNKFWEELGKDLFKKATATLVTEVVRTRIDMWKQMRLKKLRRDIDIVWREEDRIYKERREEEKLKRDQEREEAKEKQPKPQPTPEDKPIARPVTGEKPDEPEAPVVPPPVVNDDDDDEPRGDEDADGSLSENLTFMELSS